MCKVPARMASCVPEHNPSLTRVSRYFSLFPSVARIHLVSSIRLSKVVGSLVGAGLPYSADPL